MNASIMVILPSWEDRDSPGGLSQGGGGGLTGDGRQHWDPQVTPGQGRVNSEKTESSDPEFPCATGFQCWMSMEMFASLTHETTSQLPYLTHSYAGREEQAGCAGCGDAEAAPMGEL